MLHCMVDIETLGCASNAAILSIGAVKFDPKGDSLQDASTFKQNVTLQSCLDAGLHVDGRTFQWWMGQSQEARNALFTPVPLPLRSVLHDLYTWYVGDYGPNHPKAVWSHGATFDIVILANAYQALERVTPWHWRDARDTRTLFNIAFPVGGTYPPPGLAGTRHDALADAIRQAWMVQQAYKVLQ